MAISHEKIHKLETKGKVKKLIKILENEEVLSDIRRHVSKALGRTGDKRAVSPLIETLGDPGIGPNAKKALIKIGLPALLPLIDALGNKQTDIRKESVEILGCIGDDQAVEPLSKLLEDEDASIREQVIVSLGKIGGSRAIEMVTQSLGDKNPDVRKKAEINSIGNKNPEVRKKAVMILGESGAPRAIELLIGRLKDSDFTIREQAAVFLGKIGDKQAVEPLIKHLNDSDSDVRIAALGALGEIGDARAIDPIIETLDDSNSKITGKAAGILDTLHWQPQNDQAGAAYYIAKMEFDQWLQIGKPAVEPLIRALRSWGEEKKPLRAAEVLGEIGDPRAAAPLVELLGDEKLGAKKEIQDAIVKLGKPAVPELIDAMKNYRGLVERRDRTRRRVIDILVKIGDEQAIEPLINMLRDSGVQLEAAGALGEIGDEMAVEPLINALDNESEDVRYQAAKSLKKIYHDQTLSDKSKKMILSQKGRLIREKYSWENRKGCSHTDYPAVYFDI